MAFKPYIWYTSEYMYSDIYMVKQGMDLIDLRQILREMAGADFLASEATATLLVASEATMAFVMEELFRF